MVVRNAVVGSGVGVEVYHSRPDETVWMLTANGKWEKVPAPWIGTGLQPFKWLREYATGWRAWHREVPPSQPGYGARADVWELFADPVKRWADGDRQPYYVAELRGVKVPEGGAVQGLILLDGWPAIPQFIKWVRPLIPQAKRR